MKVRHPVWVALTAALLMLVPCAIQAQHGPEQATPQPSTVTLREAARTRGVILGAAADPSHFAEPQYASTLASQFRQLEPENQMKFAIIHPRTGSEINDYNFGPADQLVAFANQHDMLVRGHCFVWHHAGWPMDRREQSVWVPRG